jgi:hypothetical protein
MEIRIWGIGLDFDYCNWLATLDAFRTFLIHTNFKLNQELLQIVNMF